ncbi:MAG: ATP-dependent DNA helicase RecG [bacterium ADurb.BinA186]|nr:MAG: ATP-dependent DNA helicase RecG [bacterium ADurb.BinA186]
MVEVGVDISNATIVMVEDAERFGLAQLHQFRGRVGRGEHQSFCFVFSNSRNPRAIERLKSFENILDGFKLAEIDLKNRGAGDMFGTIQSGYNELRMASYSDAQLIQEAAEAAKIVAKEIENYPAIKEKVGQFLEHKHLE